MESVGREQRLQKEIKDMEKGHKEGMRRRGVEEAENVQRARAEEKK